MGYSPNEVTLLLKQLTKGEEGAVEKLIPLVYDELRRLAAGYMRRERPDHTLQPTALVHEAYLKLVEQRNSDWQSRAHFFGVAAQLMRRILIDHARAHLRSKRGGRESKVSIEEACLFSEDRSGELLALDEALVTLEKLDPRQSRIVELRFYGGLSVDEASEVLNISPRTVEREWTIAKAWLYMQLKEGYGSNCGKMDEGQGTV